MSTSTREPGDVIVKNIELKNAITGAKVNPLDQLVGFDVFEDITKPTMVAMLYFNDQINLIDKFPIVGEETITFSIQTPGMSQPTTYYFRVFEITNIVRQENDKGATYTVKCVSEEHFYNNRLVNQSYNTTVDQIIPLILSQYLNSKKDIIVDKTKGVQKLVIPSLHPLEAIDMCRQRAVSANYAASAFVFFENQSGFNFKTIEGLIRSGRANIGTRVFNAQTNAAGDKDTDSAGFRSILSYEKITSTDVNKRLQNNIFKSQTEVFDMLTKEVNKTDFKITDVFSKITTPDKAAQLTNTVQFLEKFADSGSPGFFVPKDSSRPDDFMDTAVALKNSINVLLNSEVTRVVINGDSGLRVGDIITLRLPETSGLTKKQSTNTLSSGNYLITRLRHMIDISTKNKHRVVFDCTRLGLPK